MKVLVIDDTPKHQHSAIETLTSHDVTVAKSYNEAIDLLIPKNNFEAVLTDLMMPMSERTICDEEYYCAEEIAYGFVLALRAAAADAKYIAVVTDKNHHMDALSAALDRIGGFDKDGKEKWNCNWAYHLNPIFTINNAKAFFVHAPLIEDTRAKNWGEILKNLTQ